MIRGFMMGFTVGFGTGLVARDALPYVRNAAKPVAKAAMKSAVYAVEKIKESAARLGETVDDLFAEVKTELKGVRKRVVPAAAPVRTAPSAIRENTSQNSVKKKKPRKLKPILQPLNKELVA